MLQLRKEAVFLCRNGRLRLISGAVVPTRTHAVPGVICAYPRSVIRVFLGALETGGTRIPGEKTADATFGAGGGSCGRGGCGGSGVAVASDGGCAAGRHVPSGGALGRAAPPATRRDIAPTSIVVLVVFPADRVRAARAGSEEATLLYRGRDDGWGLHVLEVPGGVDYEWVGYRWSGMGADDRGRGLESWDGVVAQARLRGLWRLPAGNERGWEDVAIVGAGGGGGSVENYGGEEGTRMGDVPSYPRRF